MTIYITTGNYSDHAFRGMLAQPEDRRDPVEALFKAGGGKMLAYYVTMGESDFLVISEFDDEIDAVSVLMVAAGTGGVANLSTVVAISTSDARKAEDKAHRLAEGFKAAGGTT